MLGVYTPVDPSVYSPIYPSAPDARIREIADLMREWYELFIEMRYIDASSVVFAPHSHLPVDVSRAAQLGLSRDVVDLYQMLPYRLRNSSGPNWNMGSDGGEFLMWGEFMPDMRGSTADWWRNAVDPFYAIDDLDPSRWQRRKVRRGEEDEKEEEEERGWDHERGPYMRPWYIALTSCGNHGSVMVLDTKTYRIWLIEQLGRSSDPAFEKGKPKMDGPQPTNKNDLNRHPSRPAVEFLRDMISRFQTLQWIPGGLYSVHDEYYTEFQSLYRSCGWTGDERGRFNPLLFDKLRAERGYPYGDREDTRSAEQVARETAYAPLNHLVEIMARVRGRIEQQIHIVDASHRLENKLYETENADAADADVSSEWARRSLERQKEIAEEILSNYSGLRGRDWAEDLAARRTELETLKADIEALRTRTGRYSINKRGWAGVSDAEFRAYWEDQRRKLPLMNRITELEASLRDTDVRGRLERQLREAKVLAAATPAQAWADKAADDATWENDDWEDRWSILGSGTTLVDVRTVLDEDMSLEELEKRIVYELERNEDRSWKGQRLWRNDGGKVARVL